MPRRQASLPRRYAVCCTVRATGWSGDCYAPRVRIAIAVLLGLAAAMAAASPAEAFCRSTTVVAPNPFNPAFEGCWTDGTPLAWPANSRVAYALSTEASNQVSLADATNIVHLAFGAWNDARCASVSSHTQAYDHGPVSADVAAGDCGLKRCSSDEHDSQHVIVFDDASWPHNDANNTLALTTVTFGANSGTIFDADIEVNTAEHEISTADSPPSGKYGLRSILTHEAGHFFGLAHAADTHSIMYAQYKSDSIALTQDDLNGACAIFSGQSSASAPPTIQRPGWSCAVTRAGSGDSAIAIVVACAAGSRMRRRRRRCEDRHP
jgi:hypothetical protein